MNRPGMGQITAFNLLQVCPSASFAIGNLCLWLSRCCEEVGCKDIGKLLDKWNMVTVIEKVDNSAIRSVARDLSRW